MWQYNIKSQVFEKTEHTEQCTIFFVCEDFNKHGHTSYESAGLLVSEDREELEEILALMLLDCSDAPEVVIQRMRDKYTRLAKDDKIKVKEKIKKIEL